MSRKPIAFPYRYEKNGRLGQIYKLGDQRFKTYFKFGGKPFHKNHKDFETAKEYLDREFSTLDTNLADSEAQYPLDRDRRHYYELEQRLKIESETASVWQAVDFYIANHKKRDLSLISSMNVSAI